MAKRHKVYKALTGVNEGKIGTYMGTEDGRIVLKFDDDAPTSSYLPTDVEELETLDLIPSWPAVLEMMLAVLDNKKASLEGRQAALDTLRQMAQVAQMYVTLSDVGLPAAVQLVKEDLGQYGEYYGVVVNFPDKQVIKVRIEEHDFLQYKKLYNDEPERTGQFNRDESYTS